MVLAGPGWGFADTIVLSNGRVIEADRTWYEGTQLLYEKNGGVFGLPRGLVKSLSQSPTPQPAEDADTIRARDLLEHGNALAAVELLKRSLSRTPRAIPALQAMTEAYLQLGDLASARRTGLRAARLDDHNARSRALLGDVFAALGEQASAQAEYRRSLELEPDPEVSRKLQQLAPASGHPAGPQLRIRYDGSVNEPMGVAVLEVVSNAYEEFSRRLGFRLDTPVTVVLQTEAEFQDGRTPGWAEGLNDGTIRVPVQGLGSPTPRLTAVLRHELAHSFIAARTGGNCPTWLQEGIAQWLEGGDPGRKDAEAALAARRGQLIPLLSLERPFEELSEDQASLAYAESLSAVAYIVRHRGEDGIVHLLSALGDRLPSEEALPVALALSYPEFQRSWEAEIRAKR